MISVISNLCKSREHTAAILHFSNSCESKEAVTCGFGGNHCHLSENREFFFLCFSLFFLHHKIIGSLFFVNANIFLHSNL